MPDFESQKSSKSKKKYVLPTDSESPEVISKIEKAEKAFIAYAEDQMLIEDSRRKSTIHEC